MSNWWRTVRSNWLIFNLCFALPLYSESSFQFPTVSKRDYTISSKKYNAKDTDAENLLEKASRLRKEAQEMEIKMGRTEQGGGVMTYRNESTENNVIAYTSLEDSSWIISYRFASEPSKDNEEESTKVMFYSGKMSIKLRADGYTDILVNNDDKLTTPENVSGLKFNKFWGWDLEISREDNLKYLSFSADVSIPPSDPNYTSSGEVTRFYFNSRVDVESKTNAIILSDGTVTLKRDVEPPGGFWGIFNGGGILAQFRYCGEFLCKAR